MAYSDHFNYANYGDNIVYNNCSTHYNYSNTYFCEVSYFNYRDCEVSYFNYPDCEISYMNYADCETVHSNSQDCSVVHNSHSNHASSASHTSSEYYDNYDDNAGATCNNHSSSSTHSSTGSHVNNYGNSTSHTSTYSDYTDCEVSQYSYSDCEVIYSNYNDCTTTYLDSATKCATTVKYTNSSNITFYNLGSVKSIAWSTNWNGDTLNPTSITSSIEAIKEIRDNLFDQASHKTNNASITRDVTPLNEITDSDFTGGVEIKDDDYNAIINTLNGLYTTFGLTAPATLTTKAPSTLLTNDDVEKLKKEVDNFAALNLTAHYTNHFNYLNNAEYTNHTNYLNYQNS